jgi:hypothetical protein
MTITEDESFIFEVADFRFLEKGEWTFTNEPELRLLGRLIQGKMVKGDSICVPTVNGNVTGLIVQFMERLDGWDALPFYDRLNLDNIPLHFQFCLVIMGIPSNSVPLCPSTARFAAQEPLVPDIVDVEYPDDHCGEFRF